MSDGLTPEDLPQHEETHLPPDELHVDGDNPNEQNEETFSNLIDGIRSKGWVGGDIVANTGPLPGYDGDPEGLICDGEHRLRAAEELGLTEVPVKLVDFEDDADRRYWRQHLNKTTGEHDTKRDGLEYDYLLSHGMTEEVQSLTEAAGEDLDEVLATVRVDESTPPAYEYDPDHNVYFEDCVEGMRERLDDDSVDMVFTSPPYNVEKTAHGTRSSETVDYEDDRDEAEFRQFLSDVFHELARVTKPDGHIFVNIQNNPADGTITPSTWVSDLMPLPWRSFIVWDKPNGNQGLLGMKQRGRFYNTWEPIYHFSEDPEELSGEHTQAVWSVQTEPHNDEHGPHPAPFPLELPRRALDATTDEGDVILDPFMGSGTTAVAAILNRREYVGFELDEEGAYQPIVERRIGEAKRQMAAGENTQDTATGD